jgi:uncharacterized tellurite resistance protein B-like protein
MGAAMLRLMTVIGAAAFAAPARAASAPESAGDSNAALALLVLIAAVAAWIGLRTLIRNLRARKTEKAVGGDFVEYALEVLVNAAKIDGRVNDFEKRAIILAMRDIAGEAFEAVRVETSFGRARLTKGELVDYLAAKAQVFTRDQKATLLKALLSVFVSDGRFDESEHGALIDYTEAIGFDRQSAPEMLRRLSREVVRGNIT